jgi:flagellar motor component MotA
LTWGSMWRYLADLSPFAMGVIVGLLGFIERKYYLRYIQILSYLFSLGFVVTVLGAFLAYKIEAFNDNGDPLNWVGRAMRFAADAALRV